MEGLFVLSIVLGSLLVRAFFVPLTRLENLRAFMNGFAEVVRLPPPDRRSTDVKHLVDEILILLRRELDRNQLEQVLVNVLKNAQESIGED